MAKYQQQHARNVREETRTVDGKKVTVIRFRGILRYPEDNENYVEKPEGKDTRTDSQKRRTIWREVGKELRCKKGRSAEQTKRNIDKALTEWRTEMERKDSAPQEAKQTVVSFVNEFAPKKKNSRNGEKLADTTMDKYRYALPLIDRPALRKPLMELETKDVSEWLHGLRDEGKGESMIKEAFRLLSEALDSAVRLEFADRNVCDRITVNEGKPVSPKPKVNALNEDGLRYVNALLDNLGHTTLSDCARMSLLCGMRIGEICGLRLADVDGWETGEYGYLHVRQVISRTSKGQGVKPCPKNGRPRDIRINAPMAALISHRVEALRKQAGECGSVLTDAEFVFGTFTGGDGKGFVRTDSLSKQWTMFARANNITGDKGIRCNFHSLRHSYGTLLIYAGVDIARVAEVLGHVDPTVTARVYFEYLQGGTEHTQERAAEVMTQSMELANVLEFRTGTNG